jgi:hypothetical protein
MALSWLRLLREIFSGQGHVIGGSLNILKREDQGKRGTESTLGIAADKANVKRDLAILRNHDWRK